MAVDVVREGIGRYAPQPADVGGLDVSGGNEFVQHAAADLEPAGGLDDGKEQAVVGLNGQVH